MSRFPSHRALVTGAAGGIGRAIARSLIAEGVTVLALDCDAAGLARLAKECPEFCHTILCDLEEHDVLRNTLERLPPTGLLVNAAAVSLSAEIGSKDESVWNRTWATNFEANRMICLWAARQMPEGGRILNITSVHGVFCERGSYAYGVGKAALNQLTRCLALELAPRRILVNAIAPGFVDTAMSCAMGVNELETEFFQQHYIQSGRLPLRRAAQPEEIAPLALHLLSSGNSYLTGQVITLDGGLSLTL